MLAEPSTGARTLLIRPRGGMLVRDGRPFAATPGARAASLAWPLPSTIAGALRTRIGDDLGFDWRNGGPERALRLAVAGPLLASRGAHDIRALVLVAAPEGIAALMAAHPDVRCWTAAIDSHLNERGYIIPGLGDAGDRIFGTR